MTLFDTHTHLEAFARDGQLPAVLARARAAGLESMVAIGTSPEDWALYREIAAGNSGFIHYTVGLHPCAVDEHWAAAMAQVEAFWEHTSPRQPAPVGLGEIGLDRFHLPKEAAAAEKILGWQRAVFVAGLAIAKQRGCPVVIHSRGTFQECVDLVDASGVDWAKVVFHCFTEGEAEIAQLAERGGFGSFTGILTYKNAGNVRAAAKAQGLGRFMIETDAPYLTPVPHRGKPNEPAFLRHTAEFAAAEVFGVSVEKLAVASTANARAFLGV